MANMSSISCATTCGGRLPVSERKGSRAAPSATRDGGSYPQYAFQAAVISGFTSRITQQLIGRATERAAAVGALMSALGPKSVIAVMSAARPLFHRKRTVGILGTETKPHSGPPSHDAVIKHGVDQMAAHEEARRERAICAEIEAKALAPYLKAELAAEMHTGDPLCTILERGRVV